MSGRGGSRRRAAAMVGAVLVPVLVVAACARPPAVPVAAPPSAAAPSSATAPPSATAPAGGPVLPPPGPWDYQLGGAYPPQPGVGVVVRDATAPPPPDRYGICYLNAFQTQPGAAQDWPAQVLLRDDRGAPVTDPDWPDEVLLDTRGADRRATIAAIVGGRIAGCAAAGYRGVELDNLDSYTRAAGTLHRADAIALAAQLVGAAHAAGLAVGQKNAAQDAAALRAGAGFDFAVAEECAAFTECDAYTAVYGRHVFDVEYPDNLPRPWAQVCADPATPVSVVLRDRLLVAPPAGGYRLQRCP